MDESSIVFRFDDFVVNAGNRVITRNGELVQLTPRVFDMLLTFLSRPQETISKDELMAAVWHDSFVDDANLPQTIAVLRKALGDNIKDPRYIATIPGRGYRFVCAVERGEVEVSPVGRPSKRASASQRSNGRQWMRYALFVLVLALLLAIAYFLVSR